MIAFRLLVRFAIVCEFEKKKSLDMYLRCTDFLVMIKYNQSIKTTLLIMWDALSLKEFMSKSKDSIGSRK